MGGARPPPPRGPDCGELAGKLLLRAWHALLIFTVYSLRCYVLWRSHEPQGLWCLEMCAVD